MVKHVVLDNNTHKDLKIITSHGSAYGEGVSNASIFPSEFRDAQSHYPLVFRRSAVGDTFEPVALFGLTSGENLCLEGDMWCADYIPLTIQRGPFLIGFSDVEQRQPVIHIDMDDRRVSHEVGEPLFLEHGGSSPYLERINSILGTIVRGVEEGKAFCFALQGLDLIEPFSLQIKLDNGEQYELVGFYTIDEEKLSDLKEHVVLDLHRRGFLNPIYMMLASIPKFKSLIEKKNLRS